MSEMDKVISHADIWVWVRRILLVLLGANFSDLGSFIHLGQGAFGP